MGKEKEQKLTFEEALEKLETLVTEIEEGKVSLEESIEKYAEGTKEGIHAAASEEEWWDRFLLATPLPDGRRVADLIEVGTDYSALIRLVGASSP